jgi:hypothetical protein
MDISQIHPADEIRKMSWITRSFLSTGNELTYNIYAEGLFRVSVFIVMLLPTKYSSPAPILSFQRSFFNPFLQL